MLSRFNLFSCYRTPDGYSLFACSLDGTVATFHFDVNELGNRLTDAELDELKKSRYGDVRGRQANLAESPAQLLLEAAAAKQIVNKKVTADGSQKQTSLKPSADSGITATVPQPKSDDAKKSDGATTDELNRSAPRMSSPVKQREYRRPDGRKRIIPEAVGMSAQQENISGSVQSQALDFPVSSDHRNNENGLNLDSSIREASMRRIVGGNSDIKERSGITARATISESLVIEKVPASAGRDGSISVEQTGQLKCQGSVTHGSNLSIIVFDKKEGEDTVPVCLESHLREHAVSDILGTGTSMMKETEISCARGSQTLWSDRISGKVTVLAGNANFWAVGCEDGSLQVSHIFWI